MPQPRFIDHKGTRILYLDCARASPLEHARGMRAAAAVIAPEPPGSVLLLVDVTGAAENAQTHEVIREFVEEAGPRLRARAVARGRPSDPPEPPPAPCRRPAGAPAAARPQGL